MTIDIDVITQEPAWMAAVPDAEALCRRAAAAAFAAVTPEAAGAVCIVLASDADVQTLNANYRGCDDATDVLSFAYDTGTAGGGADEAPLGDVILAFGVCSRDATADGKALGDHLSHLVVHGILHLLGYDHVAEDDATIMETLEIRILASLGFANPYAASLNPDDDIPTS